MNHLENEKSPYLLQHKDNPVNWFPWGDAAFKIAREQNKPIFLSIGYSTCYWCHVMEKDSFEISEVAEVLNRGFISIKVDREERPDVDQIYMNAVIALSGHGGWPMSVFLTPELKPFFAGTYFPRQNFIALLNQIEQTWAARKLEIEHSAEEISQAISRERDFSGKLDNLNHKVFHQALSELAESFDRVDGGFGPAPKFPQAERIRLLLRVAKRGNSEKALELAELTLKKMAYGGIYDHLAGGFSRYSTDKQWLVPHFEKMLYDNALLARAYAEAFAFTRNDFYQSVARETLDYMIAQMRGANGNFYSAEDAGEVGAEGEYYVWSYGELATELSSEELTWLETEFQVSEAGNFEGNNILALRDDSLWSEREHGIGKVVRQKLFSLRGKRERPHLDDKTLTAWNALAVTALAYASQVFNEERYLIAAQGAGNFISSELFANGELIRRYRDGDKKHAAVLDDYAFTIEAFLELFQSSSDVKWLTLAKKLQRTQDRLFLDRERGDYFYSSSNSVDLIHRRKEHPDGALPSANGVSTRNLLRLYHYTFEDAYFERAKGLLTLVGAALQKAPSAFCSAAIALDLFLAPAKEVVIVGKSLEDAKRAAFELTSKSFLWNAVICFGTEASFEHELSPTVAKGKTLIDGSCTYYVCEAGSCSAPTSSQEEARKLINQTNEYSI